MSGVGDVLVRMLQDDRDFFLPIVGLGLVVVGWSLMRPSMLMDDNKKRLPFKPVPRALFAFISLSIYLILFTLIYAFPGYAAEFFAPLPFGTLPKEPPESLGTNLSGGNTAFAMHSLTYLKARAPWFAALAQGVLLQLRFVRDIEHSVAVWLHSRRHLSHDINDFAHLLTVKPFNPGEDERNKNRAYVRRFGLNVTDLTLDAVGLVAFERWEKVATLVRALKEWVAQDPTILTPEEHKQIEVLEEAHDRKTALAINIIRLISDRGADVSTLLSELNSTNKASDATSRAKLEELVAATSRDIADQSVSISGEQLRRRIVQIQQFFDLEYSDLLAQTAMLSARAVMLARPLVADQRFERLKTSGFEYLGHLPRVSFDRLLSTFVAVAVPGFFIMFAYNRQSGWEPLARFTCIMAIAALIGVAVGSRKSNVTSDELPWSRYLVAGAVSAAIFWCVNVATFMLKQALHLPQPDQPLIVWTTMAWSMLPFLVTVSVAVLARFDAWPAPTPLRKWSVLWERAIDGLAVSAMVYVAYFIALSIYTEANWDIPKTIAERMGHLKYLRYPTMWPLQALGFIIGAFVVRNARQIAHRTLLKPEFRTTSAPAKPVAATAAAA